MTRLERELDQIYIGGRKLYVNIPKYRRNQVGSRREDRRMQGVRYKEKQKEVWTTLSKGVKRRGWRRIGVGPMQGF